MPELPDLTVYLDFLQSHIVGQTLEHIRLASPFVLRTADPPLKAAENKRVLGLRRSGKRLIFELEDDLFLMIHLMIAGRFRWKEHGAVITGKIGLAAFDFSNGTLLLTEASQKKRAAIHLLRGEEAVAEFDRGGLELSPVKLTHSMTEGEVERVFDSTREVLEEWIQRLRDEAKGGFPEKVTAFRKDMAVHGRYGQPCPVCGTPVQRIVHAENESNYCPTCQTGGKLLADRALSRLLKQDWPRTIEELEARKPRAAAVAAPRSPR